MQRHDLGCKVSKLAFKAQRHELNEICIFYSPHRCFENWDGFILAWAMPTIRRRTTTIQHSLLEFRWDQLIVIRLGTILISTIYRQHQWWIKNYNQANRNRLVLQGIEFGYAAEHWHAARKYHSCLLLLPQPQRHLPFYELFPISLSCGVPEV